MTRQELIDYRKERLKTLMTEICFERGFDVRVEGKTFYFIGDTPSKVEFEIITMNAFKRLMIEEGEIIDIEDLI